MTRDIRIAVQIPPGGTPSYSAWRDVVLRAEDAGADVVLGYDHFVVPAITGSSIECASVRLCSTSPSPAPTST